MLLLLEASSAEMVAAESVRLSPRTKARVRRKLSRTMQGMVGMVEPKENRRLTDDLAVGRSLVAAGE